MTDALIIAIIRQAAAMTRPQLDEFTTKAAEAIAALVRGTRTGIDDALLRDIALPVTGEVLTKLKAIL